MASFELIGLIDVGLVKIDRGLVGINQCCVSLHGCKAGITGLGRNAGRGVSSREIEGKHLLKKGIVNASSIWTQWDMDS